MGKVASVDVVLLIDISESMTYDGTVKDPSECNLIETTGNTPEGPVVYVGSCQPLLRVKEAAVEFVQQLYFPYDQVAVVTFDKTARTILLLSSNKADIIAAIKDLKVYEGEGVCPTGSPCRLYDAAGTYLTFGCQSWDEDADPTPCTTTNIGSSLLKAGNVFATDERMAALWVTILLTDGAPNSGVCPESTWSAPPFCRRHPSDPYVYVRESSTSPDYDAMDYAHDMADFLGPGQHSLIFSIGLGAQAALPAPVELLTYVASDDVGRGLYYSAPDSTDESKIRDIFMAIASNIATRLAK